MWFLDGNRAYALIRTFIQWWLCTSWLSCWSVMLLLRPSTSPARDAALNIEGSSTPLCSLESCSCCHLHVICNAIILPFCSVNVRGLFYITLCGLVLVKQYLCLCDRVYLYIVSSRAASKAFLGDTKTGMCPSWSSHGPYWPLCFLQYIHTYIQYTHIHTYGS